jgi:hypothetical protein
MNCRAASQHLTDHLDGSLPARESHVLERHLRDCESCRTEAEILRLIDRRLRIECGLFAHSLAVGSQAAAQQRIIAALKEAANVLEPQEFNERLWRVRWVLSMLCGPNTGARMIESAQNSKEEHWPAFLVRLSFLTTEICGRHAGELILAVGQ